MFERKGYLVIEREGLELEEDDMLMEVIEAGGEEMETSDEVFEIYTEPDSFMEVKERLEQSGFSFASAELTMYPKHMQHWMRRKRRKWKKCYTC